MALLSDVLDLSKAFLTLRAKELSESELDVVGDEDDEGDEDGLLDTSVVENMTNWAWLLHQVNGHHRSVGGLFDLLVDVTYWEMTN